MEAQGILDFPVPLPLPTFNDTTQAIDEIPSYDSFEPAPHEF
jgi:hypothetical protein